MEFDAKPLVIFWESFIIFKYFTLDGQKNYKFLIDFEKYLIVYHNNVYVLILNNHCTPLHSVLVLDLDIVFWNYFLVHQFIKCCSYYNCRQTIKKVILIRQANHELNYGRLGLLHNRATTNHPERFITKVFYCPLDSPEI